VILAAGLTPAWQQILCFDGLQLGEVNRAREAHECASGKVLNVGLALHHLRAESLTLSPLGGLPGEAIRREFADADIPARWIDCQRPTRVCTTIIEQPVPVGRIVNPSEYPQDCVPLGGRIDNPSYKTFSPPVVTELVENAAPLSDAELAAFRAAFTEAASAATWVIVSGSLPTGTPPEVYGDLLAPLGPRAILDIRGPELRHALACRPYLVKVNRNELAHTVRRRLEDDASLLTAMRELLEMGAQAVAVTQGASAVWLATRGEAWRLTPPAVRGVNPIGSGDSMTAAIAWGLGGGAPLVEALRLGVAAGAENATRLLPARLDPRAVRDLAQQVAVDRLSLSP
jgi:fructose-1-phosphate kinase PfkB-like protein